MKEPPSHDAPGDQPRPSALRLVFEYRGDKITLVSQQAVAMRPTPPHPLVARPEERGYWIVLADADGRPLYRRVLHDPIQTDTEVLTDDPDRPLARVKVAEPQGTFFVIVPNVPGGRTVGLFGPSGVRAALAEPVQELGRFQLEPERREGR
jgi:hypothetical protein